MQIAFQNEDDFVKSGLPSRRTTQRPGGPGAGRPLTRVPHQHAGREHEEIKARAIFREIRGPIRKYRNEFNAALLGWQGRTTQRQGPTFALVG